MSVATNWKVVESSAGQQIGVFVTPARNDAKLKLGWKSRAQILGVGGQVTFAQSRYGDGQYLVLHDHPNGFRALKFYMDQIVKNEPTQSIAISLYGVYWIAPDRPAVFDATLPESETEYAEISEGMFYEKDRFISELLNYASLEYDIVVEHRINSTKQPWHVTEAKVTPRALCSIEIVKFCTFDYDKSAKNLPPLLF